MSQQASTMHRFIASIGKERKKKDIKKLVNANANANAIAKERENAHIKKLVNANAFAIANAFANAFANAKEKSQKTAFIVIGIIVAIIIVVVIASQTLLKTGFSNQADLNSYAPTILILIILLYICCKW